ncbi:MAG: hypothetical protein WB439_09905 [Acidobacteriaceae bacterium]
MSEMEKKLSGPELVPELVPDLELAEFELTLARAMSRVDAPEGFAARVMVRTASPTEKTQAEMTQKVVSMRPRVRSVRMQAWMGGAIAAALALGMFGAEQLHLRRERAEQVAAANQQFEAAVSVTDHALAQTRAQLLRAGLKLGE